MSDVQIKIVATGGESAATAVRKVGGALREMGSTADAAKDRADRLGAAVSFMAGRLMYQGVIEIKNLAAGALQAADATAKAAQASGISAAEYQRLAYAAKLSGASMEMVGVGVRTLQVAIAEGRKEVAGLGLNLDELRAMSPEQQFLAVAEALRQVEDPARRTLLAIRLMGESGARMLPMIENLRTLREEADRLGLVLTDSALAAAERFNDTIARLRMQAQSKIVIAVEYAQTWTGAGPADAAGAGLAVGGGAVIGGIVAGKPGAAVGATISLGLADLARAAGGAVGYMGGALGDREAASEQLRTAMATEGTWERRYAKIFARGALRDVDREAGEERKAREPRAKERAASKAADAAAAELQRLDADFAERMEAMAWLAGQLGGTATVGDGDAASPKDEAAAARGGARETAQANPASQSGDAAAAPQTPQKPSAAEPIADPAMAATAMAAQRATALGRAGTAELGRGDERVGLQILERQAREEMRLTGERAEAEKRAGEERTRVDAELAERRARVDAELAERRARATLSEYDYRRWLLDRNLAEFAGTEEQKTRLAEIAAIERTDILEQEFAAKERLADQRAQIAMREANAILRAAAEQDRQQDQARRGEADAAARKEQDAFGFAMMSEDDLRDLERSAKQKKRDEDRIVKRAESADAREERGLRLSRRDRAAQEFARARDAAKANPTAKVEELLDRILKKIEPSRPAVGRG